MYKDNCHQDYFNSLITRYRTYLKKTDFENGNLNKIPRKKSCRNNIFLQCKKHSTEGRSRTQDITTYKYVIRFNASLDLLQHLYSEL